MKMPQTVPRRRGLGVVIGGVIYICSALTYCLTGELTDSVLRIMAHRRKPSHGLIARQMAGRNQHAGKAAMPSNSGEAGGVYFAVNVVAHHRNGFDLDCFHATGIERL